MTRWGKDGSPSWRRISGAVLLTGLGLVGCGKPAVPAPGVSKNDSTPAAAAQEKEATGSAGTPTTVAGATTAPVMRDRLHQSFADATRSADDPPPESRLPPDMTITNKPTYKILKAVQDIWDTIRFTDAAGRPIKHTATITTDFGDIELALLHEGAPNHVRNFIALTRVGYYDGLRFDRIRHEVSNDVNEKSPLKLDQVQGGCPLGTGDVVSGSIGYWLKPEFDDKVNHEEGTVGACHGIEADNAATRFYIILNKAPYLDGRYTVFAQVTRGLDVVRKIAQQPVKLNPEDRDEGPPELPIIIKKIAIHSDPVAGAEG